MEKQDSMDSENSLIPVQHLFKSSGLLIYNYYIYATNVRPILCLTHDYYLVMSTKLMASCSLCARCWLIIGREMM